MRLGILLGLAVCVAGFATTAEAAPKKSAQVTLKGCAFYGVGPVCILMRGPGGVYAVSGATPPVPVGKPITLRGTPSTDVGICFATALKDIKWRPAKGKCPAS